MGVYSQSYLDSPYVKITSITPSDTAVLAVPPRLIYVTAAGNLNVQLAHDTAPTIIPVTAGQSIRLSVKRVFATSTTATVVAFN